MTDSRSVAIATAVTGTTFYNPLRANEFAVELLSHERTLLPGGGANMSVMDQLNKISQNKGFLNQLAAAWDKDPAILDKLDRQLNSNPGLAQRFKASMSSDGRDGNLNTTSRNFAAYVANPTIETLNRLYPAPAAPKPAPFVATSQAPTQTGANPTRRETKPAHVEKPPATPDRVPPVVAAGAATAPAGTSTTPASRITAESAKILVLSLASEAQGIYAQADGKSSLDAKIKTLTDRLNDPKTGPALAQNIANAINKDPELLAQLNSPEGGGMAGLLKQYKDQKDPKVQEAIRNAIKPGIEDFLDHPEKIGDKSFRDQLAATAKSDGMIAGMNGFLQNIFGEGFDLKTSFGGIGQGFMSFLGPLFEAMGNIFTGMQSGGGFMSMSNNGGGFFDNFISGIGKAQAFGEFSRNSERFNLAEAKVVDQAHGNIAPDGKISDGFEYDAQGKRVQEEYTKADGTKATRDKYDANKDDRIEITTADGKKQKVFDTTGIEGGKYEGRPVRFYVTEVDHKTGQPVHGRDYFIKPDGTATVTNDNDGTTRQAGTTTQQPDPAVAASTPPTPPATVAQSGNQANLNHQAPAAGPPARNVPV